jgi:uncharacterized protein
VLDQGVLSFEDLAEGMKLKGKVKNVVDFGAFIDIGIKESGLIHVSEMRDGFVKDPMEVLKVGDVKEFRVISLDPVRRRIGLSLRTPGGRAPAQAPRPEAPQRPDRGPKPAARPPQSRPMVSDTVYNPFADLLKKKKDT